MSSSFAFFQAECMPIASRNTSGSVGIRNTTLKYGGPTEILPMLRASRNSGYSVPIRISAAATSSSRLLKRMNDSRDTVSKPPRERSAGPRQAKSASEPPMQTPRKARMKSPRLGSLANACTDTSTPERTRNVPSRLSEKAVIASSSVQLLNRPRFSVTASEWISAVPTSHGMNEAFSTGSQNHQPPQPSS